ncbi:hypothetical protein EDD16DRAFT_1516475 [Pisolithus croceorrhizus]|nr:hypothetical protein EV401DRAFT_1886640 [Pisolithus croceorrhizus]KAI6127837.1 hypothetical protein EDD16DRAFT_1516475 [Pisolithus croceorrhizus]
MFILALKFEVPRGLPDPDGIVAYYRAKRKEMESNTAVIHQPHHYENPPRNSGEHYRLDQVRGDGEYGRGSHAEMGSAGNPIGSSGVIVMEYIRGSYYDASDVTRVADALNSRSTLSLKEARSTYQIVNALDIHANGVLKYMEKKWTTSHVAESTSQRKSRRVRGLCLCPGDIHTKISEDPNSPIFLVAEVIGKADAGFVEKLSSTPRL